MKKSNVITPLKQIILKSERQDEQEEVVKSKIASVVLDFENRQFARKNYESQWLLNSNFVNGNQYCDIAIDGSVIDSDEQFEWQQKKVFNHIAPIIETRLAKLARVRPKMSVRPASNGDSDLKTAKVSSKILNSVCERLGLDDCISVATGWSEIAGTAFYKIVWDKLGGKKVGTVNGQDVFEGDVLIEVCSPYEIYVDNLSASSIDECNSIIHAKSLHVDEIGNIWGQKPTVVEDKAKYGLGLLSNKAVNMGNSLDNYCTVIERYTRPNELLPNGELIVVAGDKLLYEGGLPYRVGKDGQVDLPFVRQYALYAPGRFYATSIVERSIPIQRAYNAIKNRKLEFINRISVGVLAVEDGSVDIDNLEQEGLAPGKILQYRQGSQAPRMLDIARVPPEFNSEEDRLQNEFIAVSGVSEMMRNSMLPNTVSSGTAIALLIEQDDTRLSLTAQSIKTAIKKLAQMLIRMYKQFAINLRLNRVVGSDGLVELISWKSSDLGCDDVIFDTINELSTTPASRQNMLFDLLKVGLLQDENGKLSDATKYKLLDALGYGGWEHNRSLDGLHIRRAEQENMQVLNSSPIVEVIDSNEIHVDTHTAYLLSGECQNDKNYEQIKIALLNHIQQHKDRMVTNDK